MRFIGITCVVLLTVAVASRAQTTAFTYQGRLNTNGVPATANYDLQFSLRDSASGTNLIGSPVAVSPAALTNGLFTVTLDFGSGVFDGSSRWLEIGVRKWGDTNAYTVLSPRQLLASSPYAIRALNSSTATTLSLPLPAATTRGHCRRLKTRPPA